MAVGTGMGTNKTGKTTSQREVMASLSPEDREKVAKAKFPMEIANGFRLLFLFVAILGLLFVFFGGKLWEEAAWFISARAHVYNFLLWDVLLLLIATFLKTFFVAKYNHVVKNL